jgi:predicted metal-dependent enzyme (double-stranded beta helix superfamily)
VSLTEAVIELPELTADLAGTWAGSPDRWRPLVRHEPGARWYRPLIELPGLSAWLISWAPGTGLDLHDHGGAGGSVAVVEGELDEHWATAGDLADLRHRTLARGSVTTFGADHVHAVRNLGSVPAVSIHVYAPGLEEMTFYDAPAADRPGVRTTTTPATDRPRRPA